jgi:DNA-binding response OmpR family regulator
MKDITVHSKLLASNLLVAHEDPASSKGAQPDMSKRTILIVDDDADVRMSLHVRLKANDYNVIFAGDGVASIAEARKHMPDLILLDLGLPAGDGFAVMQRLKSNDSLSLIPVIIMSARDRSANQGRALRAGAQAFLQKPVENAQLLSTIRQTLGKSSQAPSTIYDLDHRSL